ncbi:MAG: IreB family regulatory phosphoprotein [Ruminococcus sp.]|nr:IreB family regulatory phosphoprotein [Ruminococcus sp.]
MTNRNFDEIKDQYIHDALVLAYNALDEKGYNALNQLEGYLFSDDPTYITPYKDARKTLEAIDRDELMKHILKGYFGI